MISNGININDITMKFNDVSVLKKVNLNVKPGQILGLLGPSGAGKTTLIKILTGQLRQTDGTADIMGVDTRNIPREIYAKIGTVLDNPGLYERLTCYDNLALFAEIYGIDKSNVKKVLDKVGLADAYKRAVNKLSAGMKQRLTLARAIMHKPDILFLDEPTRGLDPSTTLQIQELILEESKRGAAILLTTHNMEEATKLCDNVALLNQGEIVEYGNPYEICRSYNHQNMLRILLKNDEYILLKNDNSSTKELSKYMENNDIVSIHSTEPTLETVFMELTGRKFD